MQHDVSGLRRQIRALGPRRSVPPTLRTAIAAYARDERTAGTSRGAIAERLGVSAESIRRWARTEPVCDGRGELVAVQSLPEAATTLTV